MKNVHGKLAGTGHGSGGIIPATLKQRLEREHRKLKRKQFVRMLKRTKATPEMLNLEADAKQA